MLLVPLQITGPHLVALQHNVRVPAPACIHLCAAPGRKPLPVEVGQLVEVLSGRVCTCCICTHGRVQQVVVKSMLNVLVPALVQSSSVGLCICVCVPVCVSVCVCLCVCVCARAYVLMCMCVFMCLFVCLCLCVCVSVCFHVSRKRQQAYRVRLALPHSRDQTVNEPADTNTHTCTRKHVHTGRPTRSQLLSVQSYEKTRTGNGINRTSSLALTMTAST